MAMLADFDLLRPTTPAEAAEMLAREGAKALGGGTDLLPNLGRGIGAPTALVDLGALARAARAADALARAGRGGDPSPAAATAGFAAVTRDATHWRIGAGVTLAAIERDTALAAALPALVQAAASVAGPAHRSAATLGGNLCQDTRCVYYNQSAWWRLANGHCMKRDGSVCHVAPQGNRCHAAYEGDVAPALIALDAEVELLSAAGARTLPLAGLFRDDGAAHLALARGEFVVAVRIAQPAPGTASGYHKVRMRAAIDFPLAGVAARLRLADDRRIADLAVAVSGTNSQPIRIAGTDALVGRAVDDDALRALGKLVARQVAPMRSTVTAANHRRLVAVAAAERLLRELAAPPAPQRRN